MEDFNIDDVQREVTDAIIYEIKHNNKLKRLIDETGLTEREVCYNYAMENQHMIGEHFVGELEMVDWKRVHDEITA